VRARRLKYNFAEALEYASSEHARAVTAMLFQYDIDIAQSVIAQTGSYTGYRPLLELGGGYLSTTGDFQQPLCGNEEGWGPLSPFRYDFTPCFIDVWVASVAAFGIVLGSVALWWILAKRKPTRLEKDWHFYAKQVCRFLRQVSSQDP